VEGFKLGLDKTEARKAADTADQKNELTRTELTYLGGTGSIHGLTDDWIKSLALQAVPVKCSLQRLSALLTSKFFSKLSDIDDRRILMEMAIATWAMEKGKSFVGAKPICYGDTVGGSTFKFMGVGANTNVQTMLSLSSTYQPEQLVFEGKDEGEPVLLGDEVRLRLKDKIPAVYLSMAFPASPGRPAFFDIHQPKIRGASFRVEYRGVKGEALTPGRPFNLTENAGNQFPLGALYVDGNTDYSVCY
jgi:hypothetical protein